MKIGIIGGGQLGRMIALAGYPLGYHFRIWTDSKDLATSEIAEQVIGPFHDLSLMEKFCEGLDAVTFEWENVPVALAKEIASRVPRFFPSPEVLEVVQDRYTQKSFFKLLKIPTAPFVSVSSEDELNAAIKKLGTLAVLKTRTHGYDGKGQMILRSAADAQGAWEKFGKHSLILEGFVQFEREVSLVAARSTSGQVKFYPLTENTHVEGILTLSVAPAQLSPLKLKAAQVQAEKIAKSIFKKWDYAGILTIEFFYLNGKLWVNEMAARVHNSGHWTIEGAVTSQFENHLRAGMGLPLGSTAQVRPAAMLNILGKFPGAAAILKEEEVHLHHYGKTEAPKRKIGHLTVTAVQPKLLLQKVKKIVKLMKS